MLRELRASLAYALNDGVNDDADAMLKRVEAANEGAASFNAIALDTYAALATKHPGGGGRARGGKS